MLRVRILPFATDKVHAGTLENVQSTLAGFTYRMIVMGMMGTISQGAIGNSAYNTCANLCIAMLGGPAEATAHIAELDPSGTFKNGAVRIGRYMITKRTPENENVASAVALSRLYVMLAMSLIPGLDTSQHAELCSHLMKAQVDSGGTGSSHASVHQKNGGLTAVAGGPAVSSTAGFCRRGGDGTSCTHYIFAINVNVAARTSSDAGSSSMTRVARQLFHDFQATLCASDDDQSAGAAKL